MLTQNQTPFLFAAKVCSRRPPQPEMTMIVRATFALTPNEPLKPADEQGALTAEVFHEDDEARLGECLYAGDFADFKLNAEVLLKGTCYAPGGRPVVECPVRAAVGAWSKTLRVIGPRAWSSRFPGATASEPRAFTAMPLGYQGSFGGPDFARNPVGRGHGSLSLPLVESPSEPIRSRGDQPAPAGFGPLNPAWPQRRGKLGKAYGKAYREKRAPYYAEDFDWSYFSAAPADQQLSGYLRGDEEVSFHNLHPTATTIQARLPGLRVRAFVKDVEQRFREVYLAIDTLFADLDAGTLSLTWRGVDEVKEDDLSDVATVLIASEPMAERALPEAHYRAQLEAFERDPVGLAAAIPPSLVEAGDLMERERRGEAPPAVTNPEDPLGALLERKLGKAGAAEHAGVLRAIKGAGSNSGQGSKTDAALAKAVSDLAPSVLAPSVPVVVPLKPGTMPPIRLRETMRKVMAAVTDLKKAVAQSNVPLEAPQLARLAQLDAMPKDPRWSELDPSYKLPGPISTDEPGPGRDLSEQDLTDRDLSGLDLSHANLEGTILTRANLRGANLRGANLATAVLYRADLSGADLTSADLTRANLSAASLIGATLGGAVLEQAFFEDANLTDANLTDAHGEYVAFMKANLTRAVFEKARLEYSDFSGASLEQASFARASLDACVFVQCEGKEVDFTGARLAGASFENALLRGAKFVRIRGERSLWTGATLDGADFAFAFLLASHFTSVSAVGARFYGANLRECRFYKASLERAEIVSANLFSADLSKTSLSGAKFTNSSLYDAKFLQASGAGCDFTGANLKRSTLEQA